MFFVVLALGLLCSAANAGPTVAIVKYDGDFRTIGEAYQFDWTFVSRYDCDKPPTKENTEALKFVRASWSPESAAAIEKLVRQAIKLTGRDWPVKEGDTVLLKPNLVSDWIYLLATGKGTAESVQDTLTDIRTVRGAAIVTLESGAAKYCLPKAQPVGMPMQTW
jgi:hypothetical protein